MFRNRISKRDEIYVACCKEKKEISIYYLGSIYQTTMRTATRNNNTQIIRTTYWFVGNLGRDLITWKSIGIMLLVICNDIMQSS